MTLETDIAELERARDSADTERESFAVRKAKEADELRARIKELEEMLFDELGEEAATEGKDE